jgi:hypothetical protein
VRALGLIIRHGLVHCIEARPAGIAGNWSKRFLVSGAEVNVGVQSGLSVLLALTWHVVVSCAAADVQRHAAHGSNCDLWVHGCLALSVMAA